MKPFASVPVAFCLPIWCLFAQQTQPQQSTPIYRVTVVGRSIKAINYGHRSEPTRIGFQGTVLLPQAKGEAWVQNKRGATQIHAKFEKVPAPTRFGAGYLTYVLWAITPDGRPVNLGELVLDNNNKGRLDAATDLQAFGLLVTAEPYYSVTHPSDVVVMENEIRRDTVGKIETVDAKYDLLPRGHYTMDEGAAQAPPASKPLPLDRYEAVLEIYQAQNAVQIARSLGAGRYAADTLKKAEQLFQEAKTYQAQKMNPKQIVMTAREAAQAAEDARVITLKKLEEERRADEQKLASEQEMRAKAEAEAARRMAEQQEAERAARERAAKAAERQAPPPAAPAPRQYLARQLNSIFPTRDTPRGLVASMYDNQFERGSSVVPAAVREKLSKLAGILLAYPGLKVEVEGYSSGTTDQQLLSRRAAVVRDYLVQQGVQAVSMTASGLSMRPPAGSGEQPRVDLLITGEPIGVNVSRLGHTTLVPGAGR
jgi:outer membrane protein OmpA-like peptidoglycan-associated protein